MSEFIRNSYADIEYDTKRCPLEGEACVKRLISLGVEEYNRTLACIALSSDTTSELLQEGLDLLITVECGNSKLRSSSLLSRNEPCHVPKTSVRVHPRKTTVD